MRVHQLTCYACAIMPDHVHLVVRKHKLKAEQMIEKLQAFTRLRLCSSASIPPDHPIWTLGGWKSFLDRPAAARRAIHYVENNPLKSRLAPQTSMFVKLYDGWPER